MSVVLLALTLAACISGPARQATHDLGGSDHTGVDVSHANSSIADPPYFVYESEGGTIELRSPSSGAVTDVLEKVGQTITSNGLAESADGRDVYVTLIGKTNLYIEQISTVTKKQILVLDGVQPAVSPDNQYLAYAPGPDYMNILAVRDLSSGKTIRINLSNLLGPSTDLLNATITWLGDGSDVVIRPGYEVTPANSGAASDKAPLADSCSSASSKATCLIVVHFDSSKGTLAAHIVVIHDLGGNFSVISAADSDPRSLVLAIWGTKTDLYEITLSGSAVHVIRLLTLPMVLPVAFDLLGTHLFYIVGHGPTALWVAKIASGRLDQAHRLISNPDLSDIAW